MTDWLRRAQRRDLVAGTAHPAVYLTPRRFRAPAARAACFDRAGWRLTLTDPPLWASRLQPQQRSVFDTRKRIPMNSRTLM